MSSAQSATAASLHHITWATAKAPYISLLCPGSQSPWDQSGFRASISQWSGCIHGRIILLSQYSETHMHYLLFLIIIIVVLHWGRQSRQFMSMGSACIQQQPGHPMYLCLHPPSNLKHLEKKTGMDGTGFTLPRVAFLFSCNYNLR